MTESGHNAVRLAVLSSS